MSTVSPSATTLVDTTEGYWAAAEALSQGAGPVAIDVERASGFRYGERAFLIQLHRRGSGTFLLDPIGHEDVLKDSVSELINSLPWVIHSSSNDFTSLVMLGLKPNEVFDTEIAGRLAGLEKVNLGAMVEAYLGIHLPKGHSAEDWSRRPLPESWLEYAADDVNYLIDLAEILSELLDNQEKSAIAHIEFAHLAASDFSPQPPSWRSLHGLGRLRQPRQLAVARHLFYTRDDYARQSDRAVSRVLNSAALVEIARVLPNSVSEMRRIRGINKSAQFWLSRVNEALRSDPDSWPTTRHQHHGAPKASIWKRNNPETYELYAAARQRVIELATHVEIDPDVAITPAHLREVMWHRPLDPGGFLSGLGARDWQISLVLPAIEY